ncbi:uncharacterized protein LOC122276830 [Carya illinoinensis]|uniref:uncharacterized protein LOC122276830 n=1 Tax=Carya illinoinensis TaxID=32201 RepID=UPI001C71B8E9|nr:uncharacterized protein LOC122276830 [Carya illinoinensis]
MRKNYLQGCPQNDKEQIKLKITIHDNSTKGVDDNATILSSYIGTIVKAYAPFYVRLWRNVPNEIKEHIRSCVLDEFDHNFGHSKNLRTVNELITTLFQRHKGQCHDHVKKFETLEEAAQSPFQQMKLEDLRKCCNLFASPDYQHLSSTNVQNRSALTIHHRADARLFYRLAEKMIINKL